MSNETWRVLPIAQEKQDEKYLTLAAGFGAELGKKTERTQQRVEGGGSGDKTGKIQGGPTENGEKLGENS